MSDKQREPRADRRSRIRSTDPKPAGLAGRANSFGFIRTVLALTVVVSHSFPLGWGGAAPLSKFSGGQIDLGRLAVVGFFALSGFMITGSGLRTSIGRFAWHRALRILPGLWVSLLVSVLVIAPALYHWKHGSLAGYWHHPGGPLNYLKGAWNASLSTGFDVSGVITSGVQAGTNFDPGINGSLWSLTHEMLCYIVVGILAAGGVLRHAPRTVPLLTGVLWILMVQDWRKTPGMVNIPDGMNFFIHVPVFGDIYLRYFLYLLFVFLLGATVQLYKERIPLNAYLAVSAAVLLVGSLHYGGFFIFGYPAFAYLLFWAGVRLPRPFQKVGRKRDYSYGIYVYGFTVEQAFAMLGFLKYGKLEYLALAIAGTVVLAVLSWHLVESPLMKLKDWTPWPLRRRPQPPAAEQAQATVPRPAAPQSSETSGISV